MTDQRLQWLLDQIQADEDAAKAAHHPSKPDARWLPGIGEDDDTVYRVVLPLGHPGRCSELPGGPNMCDDTPVASSDADHLHEQVTPIVAHIARHDPARVLATVAARRVIVDEHTGQHEDNGLWVTDSYMCRTLRAIASIYWDSYGYDVHWGQG